MIVSEARIAANRANARKSTGPRTDEGKERSRANSLRHGMTGAGVVLAPADAAEVERKARAYRAELDPRGELQSDLVDRAALLSVRLRRSAAREAEAISARVRTAEEDFDDAREAEADRLMASLAEDPAGHLRRLTRMPEGVDRLVAAWSGLRQDLARPCHGRWSEEHGLRAEILSGRAPGTFGASRLSALTGANWGDFGYLDPAEYAGVGLNERVPWARARLIEWIDAEIARLVAHRATLDLAIIAAGRAGAATLALFDPGKEATLARKYEAAAERGLHRALRDLKALQKEPAARKVAPACPAPPLASFSPAGREIDTPRAKPARVGSELRSESSPMARSAFSSKSLSET